MEKTTVYLTTDQKRALAQAAQAQGRSEARLIREGIEAVTARHRTSETALPLVQSVTGARAEPADAVTQRPRWIARGEFVRRFLPHPADAALRTELLELAPGTTDDVEIR